MKDMKRAQRRHHIARLTKVCASWLSPDVREFPRHLGKRVTTPAPCSCWMCGNKRRYEGQTLQELRDRDRMREWDGVADGNSDPGKDCTRNDPA